MTEPENSMAAESEEQLRARIASYEARLEEIAAMVARIRHEINNPLTGLTNSLFLLRNEPLTIAGRRCLTLADEQLTRISHITRLTLSFYKEHESATEVRVCRLAGMWPMPWNPSPTRKASRSNATSGVRRFWSHAKIACATCSRTCC